jgi:hypothetical protein
LEVARKRGGLAKNQTVKYAGQKKHTIVTNIQILLVTQKDRMREELSALCRQLPRTYDDLIAQSTKMGDTIKALELGLGKQPGSEEGDAMKTYLRMQLALEHHKDFSNQGIRSAVNTTLTRLSREDEESSGGLTLDHVFEAALVWTWRRVMVNAPQTQDGGPPEVTEATKNERALIACAAQMVAEKAAKQGNRANETKMAQEDSGAALVRRELADLRNTQNQQKQAMDRLKEKAQYEDRSGGYCRQRRGGYGQDPRPNNFRCKRDFRGRENFREREGTKPGTASERTVYPGGGHG